MIGSMLLATMLSLSPVIVADLSPHAGMVSHGEFPADTCRVAQGAIHVMQCASNAWYVPLGTSFDRRGLMDSIEAFPWTNCTAWMSCPGWFNPPLEQLPPWQGGYEINPNGPNGYSLPPALDR